MNWPIWLFILAVVGTVLLLRRTKKVLFVPVLALVVYLAVRFHVWFWVSWVFWLLICLSVVFFVFMKRRLVYSTGSAALVVALLAAASAVVGGVNFWSEDDSPSSSNPVSTDETSTTESATTTTTTTIDTSPPVQLDSEMKDALTIEFSNVNCPNVVEKAGGTVIKLQDGTLTYQLKDDTLVPVGDGGRHSSSAMAPPVVNRVDPKASLDEIILSICQGSNYGGTVANMFANMTVGDTKLVDLNTSWLPPYKGDPEQINDLALKAVGTIDGREGYFVKPSYIADAERVAELLIRYRLMGYFAEQSVENYRLAAGGLVAENFPEVELSPTQENLDALVLEVADFKTGECLSRIGFNMLDKRPEIFSCSPPTTTTTTPPCTNCGTTTTTEVGRKGTPPTTTSPPPTTQPSGPTTTLACVYGTHRDSATGLCVTDNPPNEDPAPDPGVPDGNNNGPITDPGA